MKILEVCILYLLRKDEKAVGAKSIKLIVKSKRFDIIDIEYQNIEVMQVVRLYGNDPYKVVLVHGGPGAIGSLKGFSKELSELAGVGVVEAIQSRFRMCFCSGSQEDPGQQRALQWLSAACNDGAQQNESSRKCISGIDKKTVKSR